MQNHLNTILVNKNKSNGFTLVELAIVIVIIGLLLGGVLQGQELIRQAQIRNGVKRFEEFKSATIMFYGKYNVLPGDMTNTQATNFLGTWGVGNNNGKIDWSSESNSFWWQLVTSKMLNNIIRADDGKPITSSTPSQYAKFAIGKGGNSSGAIGVALAVYGDLYGGITIGNNITLVSTTLNYNQLNLAAVTANEARQIDEKIDDGKANTGILIGYGAKSIVDATTDMTCNIGAAYVNDDSILACKIFYDLGL
jgi:prepilin-type N-terminal cleavage/methylation domain-containing protein